MKGKVVLVRFPFTDLSGSKLRPALVIHESRADVVLAFISSKVPTVPEDSDLVIPADHPEYPGTGLKVPSVIKFDKIATVEKGLVEGEIGEISTVLREESTRILHRIFAFKRG